MQDRELTLKTYNHQTMAAHNFSAVSILSGRLLGLCCYCMRHKYQAQMYRDQKPICPGISLQMTCAHPPFVVMLVVNVTHKVGSKEPAVCDDELGNYIIVPDDLIARRCKFT